MSETTWQRQAVAWLRGKATEQEQNNKRWPVHAKGYPNWTARVNTIRQLAIELEHEARLPKATHTNQGGLEEEREIIDVLIELQQRYEREAQPYAERLAQLRKTWLP